VILDYLCDRRFRLHRLNPPWIRSAGGRF